MEKKAVIFARVSSENDRQDTERQIIDLRKVCEGFDYAVINEFQEHISGAKKNTDRKEFLKCLNFAKENGCTIFVSELSRWSRSVEECQKSILKCKEEKIQIYFQKEKIWLLNEDGSVSMATDILIHVLSWAAKIERESILFRLQSGRKQAKEKGVKMGRPAGSKNKADREKKYAEVIKKLRQGYKVKDLVTLYRGKIGETTIKALKKEFVTNK